MASVLAYPVTSLYQPVLNTYSPVISKSKKSSKLDDVWQIYPNAIIKSNKPRAKPHLDTNELPKFLKEFRPTIEVDPELEKEKLREKLLRIIKRK